MEKIDKSRFAWVGSDPEKREGISRPSVPYRGFQMVRTGILVCIGELFFRANGLYNGLAMFHKMVTQFSLACIRSGSLFQMGMRKKDFLLVAVFLVVLVLVGIAQERGVHCGSCRWCCVWRFTTPSFWL